jgi:hypothetical protein
VLAVALAPVVLGAGTAAHAYWTASGAGSAQVGSTTASVLVVTASAVPTDLLHPGMTGDLRFSVANPNAYAVRLTTLTGATVTSSQEGACPGSHLVLAGEATSALASGGYELTSPLLVPPGEPATTAVLAGMVTLSTQAADACQGVLFTVSLTFSGTQA